MKIKTSLKQWIALAGAGSALLAAQHALAVGALPGKLEFKQADGSSFQGQLFGDEHYHWVETQSGFVAVRSETRNRFEFARITADGELLPSGQAVAGKTAGSAPADALKADGATHDQLQKHWETRRKLEHGHAARVKTAGSGRVSIAAAGAIRDHGPSNVVTAIKMAPPSIPLLVVALSFSDQTMRSPASVWAQKLFGTQPGQMNHYWQEVSHGKFHYTPAPETQSTVNDGVVYLSLPTAHPTGNFDTTPVDAAMPELDKYVDFSQFDTNHDGQISGFELQILYIFAGGEAATGSNLPSVWAHAYFPDGGFPNNVVDGVTLNNGRSHVGERFGSTPNDVDETFGVFAHELGHSTFSLPDLYNGGSVGGLCLMGSGNWGSKNGETQGATPAPLSAWPRYLLGFDDPVVVSSGQKVNFQLNPATLAGQVVMLPTSKPHEYFLLEQRAAVGYDLGSWDVTATPANGLAIWHVDQSVWGNSSSSNVDAFQPSSDTTRLWQQATQQNYTPWSSPRNSALNDGTVTDVKVTGITQNADANKTVSFTVDRTPNNGDWKRTVVLIYGLTNPGQDMFVRGGLDHTFAANKLGRTCTADNKLCAIPIRHRNLLNATTKPWKANDNYLDWYGTEPNQSTAAQGSPMDWTTNVWPSTWGPQKTVAVDGYGVEPLNIYGQHYWMLDVDMDCSKTYNGWFELKTFISNGPGWEGNIAQAGTPYTSNNHFAQCGKVNVFSRGSSNFQIRVF